MLLFRERNTASLRLRFWENIVLKKNSIRWRRQTDRQTSGHRDSMTDPAQGAESVKKALKAIRERGSFKILLTYGARVCRQIGLNRRQLGLDREEGQLIDHVSMTKI